MARPAVVCFTLDWQHFIQYIIPRSMVWKLWFCRDFPEILIGWGKKCRNYLMDKFGRKDHSPLHTLHPLSNNLKRISIDLLLALLFIQLFNIPPPPQSPPFLNDPMVNQRFEATKCLILYHIYILCCGSLSWTNENDVKYLIMDNAVCAKC